MTLLSPPGFFSDTASLVVTSVLLLSWLPGRYFISGKCIQSFNSSWWFLYAVDGPQMSWWELTHFMQCTISPEKFAFMESGEWECSVFGDPHPMTMALSVLVRFFHPFSSVNSKLRSPSKCSTLWTPFLRTSRSSSCPQLRTHFSADPSSFPCLSTSSFSTSTPCQW